MRPFRRLSFGELGEHRPADPKKVLDRLISRQVGARRDDENEVREAVLRGWIDGPVDQPERRPARFLSKVQAAAEACTSGRFGDNKVFIVHVWQSAPERSRLRGMDLAAFKERLAKANNARLLDLSRADLVQAMDPDDVRLSEVTTSTPHSISSASGLKGFDPP